MSATDFRPEDEEVTDQGTVMSHDPATDHDPATVDELETHGITISWSLTANGWRHVVWDGGRNVFAAEFYNEAFDHAKTYASGKLGISRDLIAIPASENSAASGDRISIGGATALAGATASQGQVGAAGVEAVVIRENLVNDVPVHKLDASAAGHFLTTQAARTDSGTEANPNLATPVALSEGAPAAELEGNEVTQMSADDRAQYERRIDPFAPIDRGDPQSVWTGETNRANDPRPQASTGLVNPQADEFQVMGDRLSPTSEELGIQKDEPVPEGITMGEGVEPAPRDDDTVVTGNRPLSEEFDSVEPEPAPGTDDTDETVDPVAADGADATEVKARKGKATK